MKKAIKWLLVSLAAITLLSACAESPTEELSAAKSAFDAVVNSGAPVSHPEAMQRINSKYQEALDEIKLQEAATFANYSMAIFTLNQVADDSNELINKIHEQKGEPLVAYQKRAVAFIGN